VLHKMCECLNILDDLFHVVNLRASIRRHDSDDTNDTSQSKSGTQVLLKSRNSPSERLKGFALSSKDSSTGRSKT
jgi:hypothetical protein